MIPSMRSPLGRVRGLGSDRDGAREWWHMRLVSLALVPLSVWWVVSILAHAGTGGGCSGAAPRGRGDSHCDGAR